MRDKLIELLESAESAVYWDSSDQSFINKIADHLIANGVTFAECLVDTNKTFADVPDANVGKWIPVSERLPEPEQTVKVLCERKPFKYRYVCCGFYVPEKWNTEKSNYTWDYECCDEYDEETDAYIVNSGWYEVIHNWDDYGCVGIGDTVTHWMPMPEPPKEGE